MHAWPNLPFSFSFFNYLSFLFFQLLLSCNVFNLRLLFYCINIKIFSFLLRSFIFFSKLSTFFLIGADQLTCTDYKVQFSPFRETLNCTHMSELKFWKIHLRWDLLVTKLPILQKLPNKTESNFMSPWDKKLSIKHIEKWTGTYIEYLHN